MKTENEWTEWNGADDNNWNVIILATLVRQWRNDDCLHHFVHYVKFGKLRIASMSLKRAQLTFSFSPAIKSINSINCWEDYIMDVSGLCCFCIELDFYCVTTCAFFLLYPNYICLIYSRQIMLFISFQHYTLFSFERCADFNWKIAEFKNCDFHFILIL